MNSNSLKKIIMVIWALLLSLVFCISIIHPFTHNVVSNIIGRPLWFLIYIFLPILTVVIQLLNKCVSKFDKTACALFITIAYLLIISITSIGSYMYIKQFTPEKWKKYTVERNLMLKDLENNYSLIGMTVNEVKEILGDPDVESGHIIEYVIGTGYIDPEMFALKYEDRIIIDIYTYIEFKPY